MICAEKKSVLKKAQTPDSYNENEPWTNMYKKHIACSYACNVVYCYDDRFSNLVQIYWSENTVYQFTERKVEKAYYGKQKANCWKNILKHIREYEKDCHACDKLYKPKHTIVGDHCHETGKCTVSIHQNCNVNIL